MEVVDAHGVAGFAGVVVLVVVTGTAGLTGRTGLTGTAGVTDPTGTGRQGSAAVDVVVSRHPAFGLQAQCVRHLHGRRHAEPLRQ
ncbi:hypothetical protein GCM10010517_45630 [Streptosporangium fragile]|uniref:Secreted protein n=1 Tax=Streptosporangium fragile TaxID=46186 RepID=A0ABN3W0S2_9ACTN